MADTKQAARHRATYDKLPASDGSPTRRDVTEGESGKGHVQIDVHATRDGAAYHKGELERGSSKTAKVKEALAASRTSSPARTKGGQERPLSMWEEYNRGLEVQPLFVKSLTSFVGFLVADCLAQAVTGDFLDHRRLARMLLFAILVHGPLCHFWYKLLDESVLPSRPKSPLAIALKIALDQLLFGPLFLIIFWTVLKTFEGRPYEALPLIEAKLFPTMIVGYMLWPAAHIINFRFIPSAQRVLYINLITIFWTTYLSWSSQTQVAPVE